MATNKFKLLVIATIQITKVSEGGHEMFQIVLQRLFGVKTGQSNAAEKGQQVHYQAYWSSLTVKVRPSHSEP